LKLLSAGFHWFPQASAHAVQDCAREKQVSIRRLRPMRGLQTDRTAQVVIAGHAFLQNLRRGHYELAVDAPSAGRIAAAFDELTPAI
jgi:hypothetical protein